MKFTVSFTTNLAQNNTRILLLSTQDEIWRSFVNGLNNSAVSDEDTVQELTLVLGANLAALGELGAAESDGILVDTLEDKLVLLLSGGSDLAAGLHNNLLDVATTKEVLELNKGSVLSNVGVDGEMSIDESHLVHDTLKATEFIINLINALKRDTHNTQS